MILYSIIIFVAMTIIATLNSIFAASLGITVWYAIIATCVLTFAAFLVDLFFGAFIFFSPKKWYKPFSKLFKIRAWERKFYEKILIRKWKDSIPIGKGPIGIGFAKDKIEFGDDNAYISKFLTDSCMAEVMHFLSWLFSFVVLLVSPKSIVLSIALPVVLVNMFLQTLPIFVQRYNRPKLITLYNRNLKKAQQNKI